MPCCSAFASADLNIFRLAKWTAVERRFVRALHLGSTAPTTLAAGLASKSRQCFTTVSTAIALAISPWASPPMPSESTKRCSGSTILKQSSLLERARPTSVTPPLAIRTRTPLAPLKLHPCLHVYPETLFPRYQSPKADEGLLPQQV